jgi:hypothetical protein
MTLTGSAHPAILANSRWRVVSCIDSRLAEKRFFTAIGYAQIPPEHRHRIHGYTLAEFNAAIRSLSGDKRTPRHIANV